MRDRINPFIGATTYVLVTGVCDKCITNRALTDEKMIHVRNIKVTEVQEMVFRHVQKIIFRYQETRTLQVLLKNYENF